MAAAASMCVQHPHNFYLQALVEGGVPGLALFALLVGGLAACAGAGAVARSPTRCGSACSWPR